MQRERFQLALEHLRPAQWERFEALASDFLVEEFPNLRTLASPTGDRGRDGTLWGPEGESDLVFQYSVAADWADKIRRTVKRLETEFSDTEELVYVTNQIIGSQADDLRRTLRTNSGLRLDVRDGNWFVERVNTSVAREAAAESLAVAVVDPFLSSPSVFEGKAPALDSTESRAALVHLNLQWENDARDKGLTKLSFDALVRSALRGTDSGNRISRQNVHARVESVLPGHAPNLVARHVDSALIRLDKRFIRSWHQEDEFCLTHEEKTRINDRLTELESDDRELHRELFDVLSEWSSSAKLPAPTERSVGELREVLDRYFMTKGEQFAATVAHGRVDHVEEGAIAVAVASTLGIPSSDNRAKAFAGAAQQVLTQPSARVHAYLRSVADAYTLLAFLRETPDVQSAVVKMFSGGEIWLDASMLLPLFAEDLLPAEGRVYSAMIAAALETGMTMFATDGVIEEVVAHMHRCVAVARGDGYQGQLPYLLASFTLSGRAPGSFASWLELFRGTSRPQDDVAAYLSEVFGIHRANLGEADAAPLALRSAVQRLWIEKHELRRNRGAKATDSDTVTRLANHDVENYLGVVMRRRGVQRDSPFGYKTWWVTLDRFAYRIREQLETELPPADVPSSPVMSPDFLVSYLAIGPTRARLSKATEAKLPLSVSEMSALDLVPGELLDLARIEREKMDGMPERVVQRQVRDALDMKRRAVGAIAEGGMESFAERIAAERVGLRLAVNGAPTQIVGPEINDSFAPAASARELPVDLCLTSMDSYQSDDAAPVRKASDAFDRLRWPGRRYAWRLEATGSTAAGRAAHNP